MSPRQQNEPSSSRARAVQSYDGRRRRPVGGIEDAPLLALAGGLAAGAALAALIPTSRKERELLGPVAGRIKEKASDAVTAAKDAGQARLDELGLSRQAGSDQIRKIVEGLGDAAKVSAEAGVSAVRGQQD